MGDRSPEFPLGEMERALPGAGEETVQDADSRGVVELDDLPWLNGSPPGEDPVLTASSEPAAMVREIGVNDPLPWLQDLSGPPTAETSPSGGGTPTGEGGAPPGPWVADAMMSALDKYGALVRQQGKQAVDSSV